MAAFQGNRARSRAMAPVASDATRLADAPTKRRLANLACTSECIVPYPYRGRGTGVFDKLSPDGGVRPEHQLPTTDFGQLCNLSARSEVFENQRGAYPSGFGKGTSST